ncbi:MAG: hydrolase [Negativicutes bacterium]|nr:hydrolase [Negativicutes bacterium]
MRHPYHLSKTDSVLIVVDVQDKLLHVIHEWQGILDNTIKMIKFANLLRVPVVVTEQYPKGLGPTNADVAGLLTGVTVREKTVFSAFKDEGFVADLKNTGAKTLVLLGIEAHICVAQTALEGLARGYNVQIISDAAGSRTPSNKEIGLAKIRQAGGVISSVEIALYEWLERSDGPEFKAILPLIK